MTTNYKTTFIVGILVTCRVAFHFMASDPWVHACGVGLEVKTLWFSQKSLGLDTTAA